jgi:lipopolysaccharide cholinephosphotransferase
MRVIEIEERKRIQIEILDAVNSFCKENGIRYSLACGTMLGAIRHKGYIPWDDDIDIYMLREDYERFDALFPDVYRDKYEMTSLRRNNDWSICFAKVYDNRTLVVDKKHTQHNIGISIDVFPIDEVPDDDASWNRFNKKRRALIKKLQFANLRFSKSHKWYNNIALIFIKPFLHNAHKRAITANNIIQQYDNKEYHRVFECCQGIFAKKPFPKKLFFDITETAFEGKTYAGFTDYHTYLSSQYGMDYMTPPPPKKRISYHTINSYWKN